MDFILKLLRLYGDKYVDVLSIFQNLQGNMNHFDKDEIPILSETRAQRSDEPQDSTFQRNISSTPSASISNLVGHTGPLHTARKTPVNRMSGPLYATPATRNPFQNSIIVAGNKVGENNTEKLSTFDGMDKNEHLLKSGQLGMCNDPYCTTCPTSFKVAHQRKPRASTIFDPKVSFFLK